LVHSFYHHIASSPCQLQIEEPRKLKKRKKERKKKKNWRRKTYKSEKNILFFSENWKKSCYYFILVAEHLG